MFKSLRHRLLFWFLVFFSSNLVTMFLVFTYTNNREELANVLRSIEKTYIDFLSAQVNEFSFFMQDTRSPEFYISGKSNYLNKYYKISESIEANLEGLLSNDLINSLQLSDAIEPMLQQHRSYDSLFYQLSKLIQKKGFKDYQMIGDMRNAVHKLEEFKEVDKTLLLTLRRNEKDFLLRNDTTYQTKLLKNARLLKSSIISDNQINNSKKEQILKLLNEYVTLFRGVVDLEQKTGVRDNTALMKNLDNRQEKLSRAFEEFIILANKEIANQFYNLKMTFLLYGVLFVVLSFIVSFYVSRRITRPLIDLTAFITRFVDSNFSFNPGEVKSRSADEIGKLTLNFNIMRDKIVEQLTFFKEKVEERTRDLAKANETLNKLNQANSRFVPNQFINFLGKDSIIDVKLGENVATNMTIFFCDIRKFTEISEKLTPQENFDFINTYLNLIAPLVSDHGGFVDKFIGDSVMALYPEKPEDAMDTAIQSILRINDFNSRANKWHVKPVKLGIGIHTGHMILGTIGAQKRLETTVISDAVNTASRLEGLTKFYGGCIIVSKESMNLIKDKEKYYFRLLDRVKVKGKNKANDIYELINGLPAYEKEPKLKTLKDFERAVMYYHSGEVDKSQEIFFEINKINQDDLAVKLYLDRCEKIRTAGVPYNWDGTHIFKEK